MGKFNILYSNEIGTLYIIKFFKNLKKYLVILNGGSNPDSMGSKGTACMLFGRFQPPHQGHGELLDFVIETAKSQDGTAFLFTSQKDNNFEVDDLNLSKSQNLFDHIHARHFDNGEIHIYNLLNEKITIDEATEKSNGIIFSEHLELTK